MLPENSGYPFFFFISRYPSQMPDFFVLFQVWIQSLMLPPLTSAKSNQLACLRSRNQEQSRRGYGRKRRRREVPWQTSACNNFDLAQHSPSRSKVAHRLTKPNFVPWVICIQFQKKKKTCCGQLTAPQILYNYDSGDLILTVESKPLDAYIS